MFEVFFVYICALAFCVTALLIFFGFRFYFKLKHFQKLAKINILKRQQLFDNSMFFSSYIVDTVVRMLYFSWRNNSKTALYQLVGGRVAKSVLLLQNSHPILAILLKACNENFTIPRRLLLKKSYSNFPQLQIFTLLFAHVKFDERNISILQNRCAKIKFSSRLKAYYFYLFAYFYMREADMLPASQYASKGLDLFKKYNYPFEEAQCYLLLAQIYRISCVNDIAQTMTESAIKIFKAQNLSLFEAQATASLAMLLLFENRFNEADDNFSKALALTNNLRTRAEIINQISILNLANNDIKKAKANALQALDIHSKIRNSQGKALSLQILAHIYTQQKNFLKASSAAHKASLLFSTLANFSAYAECLYMRASALCKLNKFKTAETLLREIISINKSTTTNFHTANAYSLLGLIYLKANNFQRAKVLFQQSLHLEQRNVRYSGLVADYANLAIIEAHRGDKSACKENLEIAMEYAKQAEDKLLIELINKISILDN